VKGTGPVSVREIKPAPDNTGQTSGEEDNAERATRYLYLMCSFWAEGFEKGTSRVRFMA